MSNSTKHIVQKPLCTNYLHLHSGELTNSFIFLMSIIFQCQVQKIAMEAWQGFYAFNLKQMSFFITVKDQRYNIKKICQN